MREVSISSENLRFRNVHWKFFHLPNKDLEKIILALGQLASVHFEIYAEEDASSYAVLDKDRIRQFLSAAKDLRSLNIDSDECEWMQLKY